MMTGKSVRYIVGICIFFVVLCFGTVCTGYADTTIGGVTYNSEGRVVSTGGSDLFSSSFTGSHTLGGVTYDSNGRVIGLGSDSSFSSLLDAAKKSPEEEKEAEKPAALYPALNTMNLSNITGTTNTTNLTQVGSDLPANLTG